MTTSAEEFEPYSAISRTVRWWWALVLCAVVGGVVGFGIHRLRAPLYEATAEFMASIDFNKIDFMNLGKSTPAPYQFTQYDEDISLTVVEASLIAVKPQVIEFANQNGWKLDADGLKSLSTIERQNAYWEVRLRNTDPVLAQKVVNFWAQAGYADLQAKQKANQIPVFIYFELTHLADLPTSPTYFQTNSFVLAGGVIGLVIAILLVNLPWKKSRKDA